MVISTAKNTMNLKGTGVGAVAWGPTNTCCWKTTCFGTKVPKHVEDGTWCEVLCVICFIVFKMVHFISFFKNVECKKIYDVINMKIYWYVSWDEHFGVRFPREAKILLYSENVQPGSGVQPAPCSVVIGVHFIGDKAPGVWLSTHLCLAPSFRMSDSATPPIYAFIFYIYVYYSPKPWRYMCDGCSKYS